MFRNVQKRVSQFKAIIHNFAHLRHPSMFIEQTYSGNWGPTALSKLHLKNNEPSLRITYRILPVYFKNIKGKKHKDGLRKYFRLKEGKRQDN